MLLIRPKNAAGSVPCWRGTNRERGMSGQLDLEFTKLARERTRRHPFRSYVAIPVERSVVMWFTPRTAILPYLGATLAPE